MLTAQRVSDQAKVIARDSQKAEAPFVCPFCGTAVVLRKGRIKVHHFAHKPPVTCSWGAGETQQHLNAKLELFDALREEPNVTGLELEKGFPWSVADIYARISGIPVAIEIQRSTLSVNDIVARTRRYSQLGIAVLWAGLQSRDLDSDRYSPRAWEKWCHAAYFGRVYFWERGQVLRPVHFDDYYIEVPVSTWYEDGEEQWGGGYDKASKRWKTPNYGPGLLLSQHFRRRRRSQWASKSVLVPECTLYVDDQKKWWD